MKKYFFVLPAIPLAFLFSNVSSQPEINNIWQFADTVGVYDKFEISLRMKAEFVNPYDPDQVDVTANFKAPSGKTWKIPGFFTQSFFPGFSVRFSPDETGHWSYTVHVKDKNGDITSETKTFIAIPSEYHGPIRIAENNRYLEYHDGTPYYGVGLWYNGRTDTEVLDELKNRGVNFISRLIAPIETWGTGLGRYDQLLCSRVDELLDELEKRDMKLSLNIWFHSFLSETVWGGGNIAWQINPYQMVTDAKDFYSSDEGWAYQEKLYRYIIARWGYSRAMAIWFIVDEVNGTEGWVTGDSLGAANWARKIQGYFEKNDPWRHMTTGTRSGGIGEWWQEGYETFDMAAREIYEAQGFPIIDNGQIASSDIHPLTYSYRNYHGQESKLWSNFNKPAIIGETGWDHDFYEMSMPGYKAQYHNALWVSLASGTAMTPFWWSYSRGLNDNVITNQITFFKDFANQIPFSKLTSLNPLEAKSSEGDAYAMGSDQLIFGWAANASADMSGKTITVNGINNGKYTVRLYHTWSGRFLDDMTVEARRKSISFDVPVLKIEGSHARYIGQDVAFLLVPQP